MAHSKWFHDAKPISESRNWGRNSLCSLQSVYNDFGLDPVTEGERTVTSLRWLSGFWCSTGRMLPKCNIKISDAKDMNSHLIYAIDDRWFIAPIAFGSVCLACPLWFLISSESDSESDSANPQPLREGFQRNHLVYSLKNFPAHPPLFWKIPMENIMSTLSGIAVWATANMSLGFRIATSVVGCSFRQRQDFQRNVLSRSDKFRSWFTGSIEPPSFTGLTSNPSKFEPRI